jgi:hypothetical protein
MMNRILLLGVLASLCVADVAHAQSRFYVAATTAADAGNRGNIPGGSVPSLGAVAGVRLTDAWGIEVEVERGFRTTTAGSGESVLLSFPPVQNPTRQQIEDYGIRVRDARTQTAGTGWSAYATWRSREPGRVNVGLLGGVSARTFTTTLARETIWVSPLVTLPANYRLPDENSSRTMTAGGFSGGVLIFVRATRQLTIAPELRLTVGMITDDPYRVLRTGVRAMWSF